MAIGPHVQASLWITLALLAILVELHSRTVYLLALAAALLAGSAVALGSGAVTTQLLVIGIVCLAGFPVAGAVRRRQHRDPPLASADIGQRARVVRSQPSLRVFYRGTEWDAVCDVAPAVGDWLLVQSIEGNVLRLTAANGAHHA